MPDSTPHSTPAHAFDEAMRLAAAAPGRYAGRITPAYANMVGPFGGAVAAVMLNAALSHPERQGDPVALTVNFAAPIKDEAFEIVAHVARTNRSNQHWTMQLMQQGEVACTATALLASRRETWTDTELLPPQVPEPTTLDLFPGTELAVWPAMYEMRFAKGELKLHGSEQADSTSTLWVRDNPPRPLDFLSLAALCDTFFPRVMVRRQSFTPIGTVSLTTYFHADAQSLARQGSDYLLATARASRFHNTYFDQTAQLWGRNAELLAVTHQLVYYR